MSMLRYFFEKSEQDNSYLFKELKIAETGDKYLSYQGQYPVISISLKGMKQPTWEEAFAEFKDIVAKEIWRHQELFNTDSISGKSFIKGSYAFPALYSNFDIVLRR